ncbi:endolytic transglycosylase MltG [Acinetobacter qingfengensis]|uniref:Endolytic murein transglycosylase n=1 Tax=Acinetobacter qingfengensis TaxID=1262585 RepID=A0A1E7REB0_9GAMM|nr:endolytic transglycosylase MltG [Acinetobacter qingfengensis]KAA8734365.1 endolytic transglycosylase MltG [Acinetobacter qingfengensis]OEY97626.1 hypothetical protein BJI46_09110 [Acinetobacter qingfengensis]
MAQKRKPVKKKVTSSIKLWWKWPLLIVIVFVLIVSWILSQSLLQTFPIKGKSQWLSVEKGQNYSAFIGKLEKQGIKFPVILKLYQKLFIHDSMKAGVYEIHQGMSVRQVLIMVSDADNAHMNRIQVIEGTTFKQLKQRLKNDANVKNTILNLSDQQIMQQLGANNTHPEGLFAPNTYFFAKGETDLNILKRLYERQTDILDQAWQKKAANLPYENKYQALIMASIIEKETAVEAERKKVAGVFVRRLQTGMRLQTDPTVIYGMGDKYRGNISRENLRTPTAYNTYTINGLPPTPIALPSQRSIEAALHPDQSNNLYFVATGNGGHQFSATLEQHNQAVQQYLKVLKEKRQGN